jgi:hypothetical protein
MVRFWRQLSTEFLRVRQLHDNPSAAKRPREIRIRELLHIYATSKSFSSIRARIGQYIIQGLFGMFVALVRLAALVVEVLNFGKIIIPGLLRLVRHDLCTSGVSGHDPDAAYIVLQSDAFPSTNCSGLLEKAVNSSCTAGGVSDAILEGRRAFGRMSALSAGVAAVMNAG